MQGYKDYSWIVTDPDPLGGKLTIRNTRLAVSFVLDYMAEGMSVEEIQVTYGAFPKEAISEILHLAASQFEEPIAAA